MISHFRLLKTGMWIVAERIVVAFYALTEACHKSVLTFQFCRNHKEEYSK